MRSTAIRLDAGDVVLDGEALAIYTSRAPTVRSR
jgi:hypothetical protein